MKCFIIRRPYIDEILDGKKKIECRTINTKIRGTIGLIASGENGKIIGTVELYDSKQGANTRNWFPRNPNWFDLPIICAQKPNCVIRVNA